MFFKKYTPQEVADYYDKFTPMVLEKINLHDTFQAVSACPIEKLHEHIIRSACLKDNLKVLDAGSGIGGPSIYFAKNLNVQIEALNISAVQVELFRSKVKDNNLCERICVKHGDFHDIDKIYPSGYFDVVIFLESFGHGEDPDKILKSVFKVLKNGGILFIKDPFKISTFNPIKALKNEVVIRKCAKHYKFNYRTLKSLRKLLELNNFEIMKVEISNPSNISFEKANEYEALFNLKYQVFKKPVNFTRTYEILCRKNV